MVAAFHNGDGGNQSQFCFLLQVRNIGNAHIAHGRADLIEGAFHVVMEGACIGDVGVNAFLKAQFGSAAQVIPCQKLAAV